MKKKITQPEHLQDSLYNIQEIQEHHYRESGIGKRYFNKTLETFEADTKSKQQVIEKCKTFLKLFFENKPTGLFLIGKPGTGKTHMSNAICKEIINKQMESANIKILNIVDLLNNIKSTYKGKNVKTETDLMNTYINVNLLVLDDLGKEYSKVDNFGNSWANEKLYKIINSRYELLKPMIVTTNYNFKELEDKIDPAIVSRIIEMTIGIMCTWQDYRKGIKI